MDTGIDSVVLGLAPTVMLTTPMFSPYNEPQRVEAVDALIFEINRKLREKGESNSGLSLVGKPSHIAQQPELQFQDFGYDLLNINFYPVVFARVDKKATDLMRYIVSFPVWSHESFGISAFALDSQENVVCAGGKAIEKSLGAESIVRVISLRRDKAGVHEEACLASHYGSDEINNAEYFKIAKKLGKIFKNNPPVLKRVYNGFTRFLGA